MPCWIDDRLDIPLAALMPEAGQAGYRAIIQSCSVVSPTTFATSGLSTISCAGTGHSVVGMAIRRVSVSSRRAAIAKASPGSASPRSTDWRNSPSNRAASGADAGRGHPGRVRRRSRQHRPDAPAPGVQCLGLRPCHRGAGPQPVALLTGSADRTGRPGVPSRHRALWGGTSLQAKENAGAGHGPNMPLPFPAPLQMTLSFPPSTGTCAPVVREKVPSTRATTARATSFERTSTRRRFRLRYSGTVNP
jgi:hypothetical protein